MKRFFSPAKISTYFSCRAVAISMTLVLNLIGSIAQADELVTLNTRPGVTQSFLMWETQVSKPKALILLIPGGDGDIGFKKNRDKVEAESPYLFSQERQALLQGGFAVAVLDAPSDHREMTQEFRLSPEHWSDVQSVIQALKQRFPHTPLILMAHSRGTVSAGQILLNSNNTFRAAVFFSGLYNASEPNTPAAAAGPGLSTLQWSAIKPPVLLVHHAQDSCPRAPYPAAQATQLPLMTIESAKADQATSCGDPTSHHWLAEKQIKIGREVINWLSGKTWQRVLR